MSEDSTELDDLLGRMAEEGRLQPDPDPEEHPSSGALYGYYEGKLARDNRVRVEEHLSICGRCRDLLVEYKEFLGTPADEAGSEVADFAAAAEWRRVREKLGKEYRQGADLPQKNPKAARSVGLPLAAMFALALIGVSVYAISLRRELARPIPNLEPQTLRAGGSQRSSVLQEEKVKLPRFLVLRVSTDENYSRCLIEFRDASNKLTDSFEDTLEGGKVQFYLPERFLSPGPYRIEVLGLRGKNRQQLATFDLRIVN